MELDKLYSFVLLIVLVGMLIGIGVVTLDKFSASTFYTVTGVNDSITPTANNTHTTLTWGNITSTKSVVNGSSQTTFPAECYTVYTNGSFFLNIQDNSTCLWPDATGDLNVIYDAKDYATATRDATNDVASEISGIATSWLGLIVTVSILSIILFLVVRSFGSAGMSR